MEIIKAKTIVYKIIYINIHNPSSMKVDQLCSWCEQKLDKIRTSLWACSQCGKEVYEN